MSTLAKDILKAAAVTVDGLVAIQAMTKVGGDKAAGALAAIDKLVTSMLDGLDGKTSPEVVENEIKQLRSSLADNDARAAEALRRKFDTTDAE